MGRLEEIEARVKMATPGPWTADPRHAAASGPEHEDDFLGWEIGGPPWAYRGQFARGHDAVFIAHAREDIPWLIDQVRLLQDLLYDEMDRD